MAEIIKTYSENLPALRFIGKKYSDDDRAYGTFGAKWGEWFEKGYFAQLEALFDGKPSEIYPDGDAYLGLMRCKDGEPFEYWIGMFLPENTPVPEDYGFVDFSESKIGVAWVYGEEWDVYCKEGDCMEALGKAGIELDLNKNGAQWCFERYGCPRFTTPDENGKIILDLCFFAK